MMQRLVVVALVAVPIVEAASTLHHGRRFRELGTRASPEIEELRRASGWAPYEPKPASFGALPEDSIATATASDPDPDLPDLDVVEPTAADSKAAGPPDMTGNGAKGNFAVDDDEVDEDDVDVDDAVPASSPSSPSLEVSAPSTSGSSDDPGNMLQSLRTALAGSAAKVEEQAAQDGDQFVDKLRSLRAALSSGAQVPASGNDGASDAEKIAEVDNGRSFSSLVDGSADDVESDGQDADDGAEDADDAVADSAEEDDDDDDADNDSE